MLLMPVVACKTMKLMVVLLGFIALVWSDSLQTQKEENIKVSYEGYKVYRVEVANEQQRNILKDLVAQQKGVSYSNS